MCLGVSVLLIFFTFERRTRERLNRVCLPRKSVCFPAPSTYCPSTYTLSLRNRTIGSTPRLCFSLISSLDRSDLNAYMLVLMLSSVACPRERPSFLIGLFLS
jgi:hypothetical protein